MATIIGIHGVGRPNPGEVVSQIADGFQTGVIVEHESTLRVDGNSYPQATLESRGPRVRLIEVNWADLMQVPASRLGFLSYIFRLRLLSDVLKIFIAMWQLNDAGWREQSKGQTGPLLAGKFLRFYLAAFGIVLPVLFVMMMFAFILPPRDASFAVVAIALFLTAIQMWLRKFDKMFGVGLFATSVGLASSLGMILFPELKEEILKGVFRTAGSVQAVSIAVLLWAIVSLLWKKYRYSEEEGDTWTTFASRSALSILPYGIITGGYGALVSAFGLYAAGKLSGWDQTSLEDFGNIYCGAVPYSVALMEFVNGATTFVVGFCLASGIFVCLVASAFPKTRPWQIGRRTQDVVVGVLWLVFVGFFVVLGVLIVALRQGTPHDGDLCGLESLRQHLPIIAWLTNILGYKAGGSLMAIYMNSSLRLVPWFSLAIGPLQTVVNIVADVLCYVLPQAFSLSVAKAVKLRIETLLQHINLADGIVMAHSQGSVVAHAVLSKMKGNRLVFITAGSPLWSLYHRFLNITPWPLEGVSKWINVYRTSDYVAGEVPVHGVENYAMDRNYEFGHFGYFKELSSVLEVAAVPVPML